MEPRTPQNFTRTAVCYNLVNELSEFSTEAKQEQLAFGYPSNHLLTWGWDWVILDRATSTGDADSPCNIRARAAAYCLIRLSVCRLPRPLPTLIRFNCLSPEYAADRFGQPSGSA